MGTKIWRTDVKGDRGKKMLDTLVYVPIIMTMIIMLVCVGVVFIIINGDMQNNKALQWMVLGIIVVMVALAVFLPRKTATKANNARNIFALDAEGNFWYFTYSHPAFWSYYQNNYTKEGEGLGLAGFISFFFYRSGMRKFVRLISFCENAELIEKLMAASESDRNMCGNKILGVEKLKDSKNKTSVKFIVDGKRKKDHAYTIDITGYEDVQGLTMEFYKRKQGGQTNGRF